MLRLIRIPEICDVLYRERTEHEKAVKQENQAISTGTVTIFLLELLQKAKFDGSGLIICEPDKVDREDAFDMCRDKNIRRAHELHQ
ncbi:unnamed protein product, partial [Wuchereria bancrofti]